jgi:hypothetical protein
MSDPMEKELIAPCGMNCGLCSGYLALSRGHKKKRGMPHCAGCRIRQKNCAFIKKRCETRLVKKVEFCHECMRFPCENLKKIDKRYRTRYDYSFIENLKIIREKGLDAFLEREREQWKCPNCGDVICIHNGKCYKCQTVESWRG